MGYIAANKFLISIPMIDNKKNNQNLNIKYKNIYFKIFYI